MAGAITIAAHGAVQSVGGAGISAVQVGTVAAGDIKITTTGTGPVTGTTGITTTAIDGAAVIIDSTGGLVTGNGAAGAAGSGVGDGIFAKSTTGAINITSVGVTSVNANAVEATSTTGGISIATHGPVQAATTGTGILATQTGATAAGNISITTTAAGLLPGGPVTGGTGIRAIAVDGATVTIDSRGGLVTGTAADGFGIGATSTNGNITIDSAAVTAAASGANGIQAVSTSGTVTVRVATGNAVNGGTFTSGATGFGIVASTGGNGGVSVTTGGAVTASTGIAAETVTGNGSIFIDSTAGKVTGSGPTNPTSAIGDGVFGVAFGSGDVTIKTAAVQGAKNGIEGASVTGAITIATQGAIGATGGVGIIAQQSGPGTATGDVKVTTATGTVTGGSGIAASAIDGAAVTVDSRGGLVTGTAANGFGIEAIATNGNVTIDSASVKATAAGSNGIIAQSDGGDVTVRVAAGNSVTGGTFTSGVTGLGIFGSTGGGGGVSITTGGAVTAAAGIFAQVVDGAGSIFIDTSAGKVTGNGPSNAGDGVAGVAFGSGQINIKTGAVQSAANGISAQTVSGAITIATQGAISGTAGVGIIAQQLGPGIATGDVKVTTSTGTVAGTSGIMAYATDGASVTIDSRGGLVTGNGSANAGVGFGILGQATTGSVDITTAAVQSTNAAGMAAIYAQTGDTGIAAGAITIHAHGAVTSAGGAGITAIQVAGSTSGGNILISNVGTGPITGATFGIDTQAVVNDSIDLDTQGGKITGLANDGIRAQSANGAIHLETVAVSGNLNGINAQSGVVALGATKSGAITIITHDDVNGGTTANTFGIQAVQNTAGVGNGNISVDTTGAVTGNGGINAAGRSNATVTVDTTKSPLVTGTGTAANGGVGINAVSEAGNIQVNTGAVTATNTGATAINATSTAGGAVTVTVTAGNAINGSATGTGIIATTAGGNGNASVTTGGSVTAGVGINAAAAGNGAVTVNSTAGLVTGQDAAGIGAIVTTAGAGATNVTTAGVTSAANGITSNSAGGPITVVTNGQVGANGNFGIFAHQSGGNGSVSVTNNNTVNGFNGVLAAASGAGNSTVTTAAGAAGNVTGTGGFGIWAEGVNGATTVNANAQQVSGAGNGGGIVTNGLGAGTTTINVSSATLVSGGTNLGAQTAAGITATNTTSGAIVINNNGQCTVLNCQSGVIGLGNTVANAAIAFSNNTGTVTVNNNAGAFIGNNLLPNASVTAWAIANSNNAAATGSNIINNASTLVGRVQTGAGNDFFYNMTGSHWALAGAGAGNVAADFGAGVDTLVNNSSNSIYISGPLSNMNGVEVLNNTGTIHSGNAPCEAAATAGCTVGSQVNFNATAGLLQTVTNSSFLNINGHTTFNSTAASGSSFLNTSGGVIDMSLFQTGTLQPIGVPPPGTPAFPASTHVTTDYLALNATTTGTSDLNYGYTFGTPYNYTGAGDNRAYLDTNIGAPGSASDRVIVSGTATGRTNLYLWDTSTTPGGSFNPTGITLAAVNGASINAFFLGGQTNPLHQTSGAFSDQYLPDFGPMGAIKKGLFVYPLLQAPLPGSPAGSRYVLLGLPDIEAFQIPLITTTAQNVFNETALAWLDHQDEVRNWMRDSNCRQGLAAGSGADLYIKSPICQPGGAGSWLKAIGSWTDRNVTQSLGDIAPAAAVLTPFDLGYRQSTYALYGGLDFGREALATAYDAGVMGLMAGYIESHVNFKSSPTRFDYTGGTVGVSGTYINGGFFLDGLAKADILEMKGSFPTLAPSAIPSQSLQVINVGGLGNIGYRWDVARLFYLEPIGSVSYVLTHVNNFDVPGLSVQFSDGQSLRGALGVRTGVNWLENSAYQIDTSLTAKVWGEFLGNNPVNFVSVSTDPNAVPLTLNDKVSRVFAEVAAQANFTNKGTGWSAYLNTTMRFNDQFTTISGRTGVRYQW